MPIPWLVTAGITPSAMIRRYLRNSNGDVDMKVDGSDIPMEFKYTVPAGGEFLLMGIRVGVIDVKMQPHRFGNLSALNNGVLLELRDELDVLRFDMTDGEAIKRNSDFAMIDGGIFNRMQGDASALLLVSWVASGDDEPIILPSGWSIVFTIRDDLLGLSFFRALVKGRWEPE